MVNMTEQAQFQHFSTNLVTKKIYCEVTSLMTHVITSMGQSSSFGISLDEFLLIV